MRLKSTLIALVGLTLASSAFAVPIGTGVASWTVNSAAVVVETANTLPTLSGTGFNNGWVENMAGMGVWVGRTATSGSYQGLNSGDATGQYVYELALGALLGGSGGVTFQWAADNTGLVQVVNGAVVTTLDSCGVPSATNPTNNDTCYQTLRNVNAVVASSATILRITVQNGPTGGTPNPTGLIVKGDVTATPEPSTYAMLALGGVAVAFARLRRK